MRGRENTNQGQNQYADYKKINVTSDVKDVSFLFKTKDSEEKENGFFGNLTSIKFKAALINSKKDNKEYFIETISLSVVNDTLKEIYYYDFGMTMQTRALLNSIINLKTGKDIEFSIWRSKPKEDGSKPYVHIGLKSNGEKATWKYSINELPKPIEAKLKGDIVRDYTNQEEFLLKELFNLSIDGVRIIFEVKENVDKVMSKLANKYSELDFNAISEKLSRKQSAPPTPTPPQSTSKPKFENKVEKEDVVDDLPF